LPLISGHFVTLKMIILIANKEELSQDYMYNGVGQKSVLIQPLDREQKQNSFKKTQDFRSKLSKLNFYCMDHSRRIN